MNEDGLDRHRPDIMIEQQQTFVNAALHPQLWSLLDNDMPIYPQ